MIEIFLAPQTITLLTSLAPVGAWIAKESGVFAKSIAVSTITDFIKDFFKKRITQTQLRDIYVQSVQAALDDHSLKLDKATRMDLVNTQDSFIHFLNFVNTYDELNILPFTERRKTSIKILREYIKKRVDSISDEGLDKIVDHFSYAAFGLINECISNDPEAFYREGLASLERIEYQLKENAQKITEINENLKILKTTALYYQKLAPEIEGFSDYLSKIDGKIDEIRSKVDEIRDTQNYQTSLLESIHKNTEIPFRKSVEYIAFKKGYEKLKKTYHALPESEVQLRLEYSKEIEDREKKIKLYEQDVIRLYEIIQKIPKDNEFFEQIMMHIDAGEYKLASETINNAHLEEDQQHLLTQKESLDLKLCNNALAFLIKAQITKLACFDSDTIDDIKKYYIQSITSYPLFNNLSGYADFLYINNCYNDAENVFKWIITDFRISLTQDQLAQTLGNLAILHNITEKYKVAEAEFTEALSIYKNLADANPDVYMSDVAGTLNNLALLHIRMDNYSSAEAEFTEALSIYKNLSDANPEEISPMLADILNNQGVFHLKKHDFNTAEAKFSEAFSIYKNLADANPHDYMSGVAVTLLNIATLHRDNEKYIAADDEYKKALSIYKNLAKDKPLLYLKDLATTLNSHAILNSHAFLHDMTEKYKVAEAEFTEALSIYKNLSDANPNIYTSDVAGTLNNLALLHIRMDNYSSAEAEFTEAISIYKELADVNSKKYSPILARILNDLGVLHAETKKYKVAEVEFTEALSFYKKLIETNPEKFTLDLARTYNNLGNIHTILKKHKDAEAEYSEALSFYRRLADANPEEFTLDLAQTLGNQAILHEEMELLKIAEAEYTEALSFYRRLADANPEKYSPYVEMVLKKLEGLRVCEKSL